MKEARQLAKRLGKFSYSACELFILFYEVDGMPTDDELRDRYAEMSVHQMADIFGFELPAPSPVGYEYETICELLEEVSEVECIGKTTDGTFIIKHC